MNSTIFVDKDGYKCSNDGRIHRILYYHYHPDTDKKWHIHHIDHNKLNNDITNLIALPEKVHNKVHRQSKKLGRYLTRQECNDYLIQFQQVEKKIKELKQEMKNMELKLKKLQNMF
jgi:predicted  nucleic acid-binding Zn-ribbon protein